MRDLLYPPSLHSPSARDKERYEDIGRDIDKKMEENREFHVSMHVQNFRNFCFRKTEKKCIKYLMSKNLKPRECQKSEWF